MTEHLVVELAQVEPAAVALGELTAERFDRALAELVGERLARPRDVAVRLDRRVGRGQPGRQEEVDRLLAAPAERVEPRVDDEPGGSPGLGVEHPEALALGTEQAHLVREPLRVEAPALDVCPADDPRAEAAEHVEVRVLHLERDLEVVAGHSLVIGRRRELRVLPARQVVPVRVVDARAPPVGSRRVVVRERRIGLLVLLDRPDLEARPRHRSEIARRDREGPRDVLTGPLEELVLRARAVGGIVVLRLPQRDGVVAVPGGRADGTALLVDRLELVEADLMDERGVHVHRRPGADLGPVQGVAIRGRPEPGVLAGGGEVVAAERIQEYAVGRADDVTDDLAHPLAVGLRGDLRRRRDRRLVDRCLENPLELGDRPLHDDAWGGQSRCAPFAEEVAVRRHEGGVGTQPGLVLLEPLGRVGLLELGHDWQERLGAAHLVDHPQDVRPLVLGLDAEIADHLDHVDGDPVLHRETVDGDRLGLAPRRPPERELLRAADVARVLEAIGVALVAVHRGGRGLQLEERLPEPVGEVVDDRGWLIGHRKSPNEARRRAQTRHSPGTAGAGHARQRSRYGPVRVRVQAGRAARRPEAPRVVRGAATGQAPVPPNIGSCSPVRSTMGSSPRNGSRSASVASSRAAHVRRWFALRMCQLPASAAWRRSGERSSL